MSDDLAAVTRYALAPGYTISRIIKGGWQLAGGHGPVDRHSAVDDMARFVDAGVTTFDCADIYTGVEALIGEFLGAHRGGAGAVERGIQVHTKFVPDRGALHAMTKASVACAIDRSLQRLGVERLDLVQFHWWDYDVPGYVDGALHLAELQRIGKIRLIGATNFDVPRLRAMLDAGVPIATHQVQYSLLDRRPGGEMSELCRSRGVTLLCYGSLAGGFLSERWLDASEPRGPLENRSLVKYKLIIDEFGGWLLFQRLLRVLRDIADHHHTTIGAVAIRHVLDRAQVGAAIVGARHARHLPATLDAFRVQLDDASLRALDEVLDEATGPAGDVYALERVKDGRHATIMRYDLNEKSARF